MLISDEKAARNYAAFTVLYSLIVSFKILIRAVLSLFKHRTTPQ